MSNKVALVIAHQGYQPIEYGVTKKTLEDEGYAVITVSDQSGFAQATDNSQAEVTYTIDEVDVDMIDALFLIGGSGALKHLDNPETYDLIQRMNEAQKPFGAICISTRILAYAGVLDGKRATGWDGDNELTRIYQECGVNYIKEPCVTDQLIVTAVGPANAHEFAENIITLLQMDNYDELTGDLE